MSKWNDWAVSTKYPPIKSGYGMNCRTDYKIDVVFKVRTGKGYWRSSKYLYVCNNNTIYLLGSDAGIHHITEELPSNLEAKVREYINQNKWINMTNEQLNQYYSKDADKKQCWVSKDHNCPLKEQCNGLVKPECKEHIDNEDACHAIDKMIEWYYQVEEPEFLKFYNCHLEMIK